MTTLTPESSPPPGPRTRPRLQRWLLRLEALVCFMGPVLGLFAGLLYWELWDGRAGGNEKALNIGIVVGGVLGLYGLFALTNAATHSERPVRWPWWLVLSLCLGAAACGAAVRFWDFGWLSLIVLPLFGVGHFLILTRHQWGDAASRTDSNSVGRTLGRWVAVGVATTGGSIVAGPPMGLQVDYTIDPTISREFIERKYGPLLDPIDALPAPPDESATETKALRRKIAADSTLIYARLDVTPANESNALWFEHANRDTGEYQCYMRSQEMQSAGLIRCRMTSDGQLVDMLRYGRYGLAGTRSPTASRNLEVYFDYQKLLATLPQPNSPTSKSKAP